MPSLLPTSTRMLQTIGKEEVAREALGSPATKTPDGNSRLFIWLALQKQCIAELIQMSSMDDKATKTFYEPTAIMRSGELVRPPQKYTHALSLCLSSRTRAAATTHPASLSLSRTRTTAHALPTARIPMT